METYNYLPNWLIQNILKNFKILLKYIKSISIMFQNKSVNQKSTKKFFKKIPFSSSNMKKRRYNALCKTKNTNKKGEEKWLTTKEI